MLKFVNRIGPILTVSLTLDALGTWIILISENRRPQATLAWMRVLNEWEIRGPSCVRPQILSRGNAWLHRSGEPMAQLSPVVIGMEACGGAHYWARRFREHRQTVKLMAPQFVPPYVTSNTPDMAEVEAMGQAVTRPTMRFVPLKEVAPQALQALQRREGFAPQSRTRRWHIGGSTKVG
jgi:transposase